MVHQYERKSRKRQAFFCVFCDGRQMRVNRATAS